MHTFIMEIILTVYFRIPITSTTTLIYTFFHTYIYKYYIELYYYNLLYTFFIITCKAILLAILYIDLFEQSTTQ